MLDFLISLTWRRCRLNRDYSFSIQIFVFVSPICSYIPSLQVRDVLRIVWLTHHLLLVALFVSYLDLILTVNIKLRGWLRAYWTGNLLLVLLCTVYVSTCLHWHAWWLLKTEVLLMLHILLVNCIIVETLIEHSRAVNVGNSCRICAEMGLLCSWLSHKSLLFDWWGSFGLRDVNSIPLIALLNLWDTVIIFVYGYCRLNMATIVVLLTLEIYHLWKNLFSPVVALLLSTFREKSLVVSCSSTNVIGIDSVVLCPLV